MGEANNSPRVAVVILNWNNADDTLACLDSVTASDYPANRLSIIVVDNGSTDDSVNRIRLAYQTVTLVVAGANLGFTGGNNVGIRHAISRGCDYLWLLNDDITVASDALSVLARVATESEHVAAVGPIIYMREAPNCILSFGCDMDGNWRLVHRGLGEIDRGQYGEVVDVDYMSGASMFVSAKVIENVGLFDEDFFAYYEDVEWCRRVRMAGWRILCVPQAKVWHPDPKVRDETSGSVTYYTSRNQLLFLRKSRLGPMPLLSKLIQYLVWLSNWSLNPKWRHYRVKRDALLFALIDFIRGKTGRCDRQL